MTDQAEVVFRETLLGKECRGFHIPFDKAEIHSRITKLLSIRKAFLSHITIHGAFIDIHLLTSYSIYYPVPGKYIRCPFQEFIISFAYYFYLLRDEYMAGTHQASTGRASGLSGYRFPGNNLLGTSHRICLHHPEIGREDSRGGPVST